MRKVDVVTQKSPAGLLVLAKIKATPIPNNILAVKKSKKVKDLEHVVRLGNSDCFHTTKPKTRMISQLYPYFT